MYIREHGTSQLPTSSQQVKAKPGSTSYRRNINSVNPSTLHEGRNMKRILAIATLLLATSSAIPAVASPPPGTRTLRTSENPVETEGVLIADSRDDAWRRYRDDRHRQLDRQVNDEMNKPHNSRLSQKQKEQVIRDAHKELDKQLDREEKEWKKRYSDSTDRNDRFNRRYDGRNDRNRDSRYDDRRNDRNRDTRYDDRRNDRTQNDHYYQVDPQNPYEQYRRRVVY